MLCVANTSANAAIKDGDFASGWNTWKDAAKGDLAEYALGEMTKRIEVNDVKSGNITYTNSIIKDGQSAGRAKAKETSQMAEDKSTSQNSKRQWHYW